MSNRLAAATSPYLLQHKDNPVDWWPWCDEAFDEARRRNVPVFLSVGYAACHWCHVMAHESFEDDATAAYLNDHFVSIKVDREERPDVDAVYMEATQAMTGQGGWPMSVFLTPDAEPFYCGTYFPPVPRHGMPSFRQLLESVADAWTTRRAEVAESATAIVGELNRRGGASQLQGSAVTADKLDAAAARLSEDHDDQRGGFGGAPKFPPSMALEFLLRHAVRSRSARSLQIVETTGEAMARGGMYDQLAGGFARYSVDADWVVPHFEKMLYDNALLARLYLHWWRQTGKSLARRIATETCEWMLAELLTAEGGFASSLDADSEGEEGKFYVWAPGEVGARAAEIFSVTESGTFEHGRSVLQLLRDPVDLAAYAEERARLLDLRALRVRPGRDDKVVASWNGLAIAALAECGVLLGRDDFVEAGRRAADLLLRLHLKDGRLLRASRDGIAGTPVGVLEDYGNVADGLLALHQATGERAWLDAASELLDTALARFTDGEGGFFDTADDAERLVRRPRDPTDGATPSGMSALAGALLASAALTGNSAHRDAAEGIVNAASDLIERFPRFAGASASVAEAVLAGPLEVAVVGSPELAAVARRTTSPGAVVVTGGDSPLLVDRPAGAAYLCRGFVCDAPSTDPAQLAERIAAGPGSC
jgi:uncharacterized protein YyaL (SSP411 family)